MSAVAAELTGGELERGIEVFSRVSLSHGAKPWGLEDVQPPAALRLFRAKASRALGARSRPATGSADAGRSRGGRRSGREW